MAFINFHNNFGTKYLILGKFFFCAFYLSIQSLLGSLFLQLSRFMNLNSEDVLGILKYKYLSPTG